MAIKPSKDLWIQKKWTRYKVCYKKYLTPDFLKLLANPEAFLNGKILKDDGTTTKLALAQTAQQKFVIKKYNIKNFRHGLKRALQPTRAIHCWENAHRLLAHSINTPKPVAIVEKRFGFIRREAYYIYEYIDGINAENLFTEKNFSSMDLIPAAKNLISEFQKMFHNAIVHSDMKITNFIFADDKPYIIDLDGMRQYKNKRKLAYKIQKDKKRFLENWHDSPNVSQLFMEFMN